VATATGAIPPQVPGRQGAVAAVMATWRDGAARRALTLAGLVTAVGGAAGWIGAVAPARVAALACGLGLLALAAGVDAAEHRLPNGLVLAAAVPVVIVVVVGAATRQPATVAVLLGATLCGAPMLLAHLIAPAGLGFGDVKAATALGGLLGLVSPVVAVGALLVALAASGVFGAATGRRAVPLGPGLVVGATVALVAGRLVGVAPW